DWTLHRKYRTELGIAVVSLSHVPQSCYPAVRGLTPTRGVEIQPHARENLSGVSFKLRSFLLRQGFAAFRFLHFRHPLRSMSELTSSRLLQRTFVVGHKLLNSFCGEIVPDIKTLPCSIQIDRFVCNELQRLIGVIRSVVDKIFSGEGKR